MTADNFNSSLRTFLRRQPFVPFVVKMNDGKNLLVDDPQAVAFGGGDAAYIGPDLVHFIYCQHVENMHLATAESVQ